MAHKLRGVLTIVGIIAAFAFASWFSGRNETKGVANLPNEQNGTDSRLKVGTDSLHTEGVSITPSKSKLENTDMKHTVPKIIFWICWSYVIVAIIFLVGEIWMTPHLDHWDLWEYALSALIITAPPMGLFALSYLGSHIVRGNKGAIRLGVLISALWVVCCYIA